MQGSDYSFVKELFAAIDDVSLGWSAPFSPEIIPILLRQLEDLGLESHKEEFFESLSLRYLSSVEDIGDEA